MTMKKFITMDLETGKKVLQTIEASFIKLSNPQDFSNATNLEEALKAEIARALAKENALTEKLEQEIQKAKDAETAIRALIGDLGQDKSVKEALDRIKASITTLTEKVEDHIADTTKHLVAGERDKWNAAVETLKSKADKDTMAIELEKKVAKEDLFAGDKIKTEHLPSIAINSVTTVATIEAAMKLPIENGDVVIINPDARVARTQKQVVKGTFICVDIDEQEFDKRFRQLYSNSDSISKAEVDNLIKAEADRAKEVEEGLRSDILIIKDDDDTTVGSIKHAVKIERERAEEVEQDLDDRLQTVETTVQTLAGDKDEEGSAAYLADVALTEAKEYTGEKIEEVNTAAGVLSGKVQALEDVVGGEQQGLVKDVADLKSDVETIKGDEHTDGSIKKALADAQKYADTQVANEKTSREQADNALSDRVKSLEANENLSIKLGYYGVREHELLTIGADRAVVKATLADSSVVGIVARAEGPNSKTVVSGRVSGLEGLIPGQSYFLGRDGQITPQMPTNVGEHIIKVGVALTETDLFVNIQEAIEIRE